METSDVKKCTRCGKEENRSNIVVLKVAFHLLGKSSLQVRSRNTDWLCPECCGSSPEWNTPKRLKTKTSGIGISCDGCHGEFPRDEVMVVKVIFYQLGNARVTLRSRTSSWLCFRMIDDEVDPNCCVAKDSVWNQKAYRGTPGWEETNDEGIETSEGV